jgi:prepilin peptidase CpaA
MLPLLAAALILAFTALVLAAALRDAMSFTIPNWISLALAAIFPFAALASGVALPTVGVHVAVGALALAAGMLMFALRWVGGGDAKLMAAVLLWLGWPAAISFLVGAAMAGGVLAMVLLTLRSAQLRPYMLLGPSWMARLAEPGEGVPYGVAIAAGALWALPQSSVFPPHLIAGF